MKGLPPHVRHVRCSNPGPMTLSGTNTYVVPLAHSEGRADVAIIDPGPELARLHEDHLRRLVEAALESSTTRAVSVLLTHHHEDHQGGVGDVVSALEAHGVAVDVFGADHASLPDRFGELEVLRTPGHTQDSVCFLLEATSGRVLFSGDTLLGGSSSFIAHPDGDLTDYLASLDLLAERLSAGASALLAPGHGEVGADADRVVQEYREHRRARLEQVRNVLDAVGPEAGIEDVIHAVYADVDPQLRPAVEAVVAAQVKHLRGRAS